MMMMLILSLLSQYYSKSDSTDTNTNNKMINRSILLSSKIVRDCCIDTDNTSSLSYCINNHHDQYRWSSTTTTTTTTTNNDEVNNNIVITFAIVSYSDSHIHDYSTYSLAINSIWSQINGYSIRLYTPNDSIIYDKYDSRWNKVIVVNDALNDWANQYDYIVWMDSDLIIMDLQMRLEYIVYKYNNANLIISKDPRIENGIVNTGMFIIKNTIWSKKFINDWWNKYDRSQGMDQHIFDKLWYDNINEMMENVVLLPVDEINSHFPAWVNQKDHNTVLHLAGTNNQFRRQSFKLALDEICYSYLQCSTQSTNCLIKSQLGLTRNVLQELYHNSSTTTIILNLINEAVKIDIESYFHSSTVLDDIISMKERFANQRQSGYNSNVDTNFTILNDNDNQYGTRNVTDVTNNTCSLLELYLNESSTESSTEKTLTLQGLRWVYCSLNKLLHVSVPALDLMLNDYSLLPYEQVNMMKGLSILIQNLLDASFDLLVHNEDNLENYNILISIAPYVELFVNAVPSEVKHIALYYKVKHREFSSNCCRDLHNGNCQLQYLFETYEIWKELDALHWYGAGNGMANPYKEYSETLINLATLLCSNNRAEEGLVYAQESLRLTNKIWADSNEYEKELSDTIYLSLISKYITAGLCAKRCATTQSHAIEYANDAYNVLLRSKIQADEYSTFNKLINNLKMPTDIFDTNCTSKNKKWLKKKYKHD